MFKGKWKLWVSSLIIVLPSLIGLLFYDALPAVLTTHWGADGAADGFSGKDFTLFVLPLVLLAFHWLCIWITFRDKSNKDQMDRVLGIALWIVPFVSIFVSGLIYGAALGVEFNLLSLTAAVMGLLFAVMGNIMPKVRRNSTMGIKVEWTLADEETWNATHRFAGKIWFFGGLIIMLCALLPIEIMMIAMMVILLVLVVLPVIYSYRYYKKRKAEGKIPEQSEEPLTEEQKKKSGIVLAIVIVILALCAVLCFTGDVDVALGEESFTVKATYYDDLTVSYNEIDSIEYVDEDFVAYRVSGFGSPRLSLGIFESEKLGRFTSYSYTDADQYIVLRSGDKILVLSGKNEEDCKAIYEQLLNKTGK